MFAENLSDRCPEYRFQYTSDKTEAEIGIMEGLAGLKTAAGGEELSERNTLIYGGFETWRINDSGSMGEKMAKGYPLQCGTGGFICEIFTRRMIGIQRSLLHLMIAGWLPHPEP